MYAEGMNHQNAHALSVFYALTEYPYSHATRARECYDSRLTAAAGQQGTLVFFFHAIRRTRPAAVFTRRACCATRGTSLAAAAVVVVAARPVSVAARAETVSFSINSGVTHNSPTRRSGSVPDVDGK